MRRRTAGPPIAYLTRRDRRVSLHADRCAARSDWAHVGGGVDVLISFDGDTLTLRIDGQAQTRVRLNAIDAPEKRQAFGMRAKQALSELCFGKTATLDVIDVDQYGRKVAEVWCDGTYANGAMVEQGLAWVYRRYAGVRADLYAAELDARLAKRGLWGGAFATPPWDFRKSK